MEAQTQNVAHTPGPWEVGEPKSDGQFGGKTYVEIPILGRHGLMGIPCSPAKALGDRETAQANARLIAAAPDLLAACIALLAQGTSHEVESGIGMYPEETPACAQARAAIAKATRKGGGR